MNRIEKLIIAALVMFLIVTLTNLYSTWRGCSATGGKTVRGLFGLECVTTLPYNPLTAPR